MTRLHWMTVALILAFLTGWLAGTDFPPPHVKDIRVGGAFWLFLGLIAGIIGIVASSGNGRNRRSRYE